jgi:DNA-binding MarR family transcriptional regulator
MPRAPAGVLDGHRSPLYSSCVNRSTERGPLELLALLHAAHAADDFIESRLSPVGLSVPRLAALQRLVDAGGSLPLGQLADRLACVKSNVTQLVDRLEADGLVARRPDARDRRATLAALTPAGRKACDQGTRVRRETERSLLGRLSADEARQLGALVAKVGRARK